MNETNFLRRRWSTILCIVTALVFSGCKGGCGGGTEQSADAGELKATKMTAVLPSDLAVLATTEDVYGLKKELSQSEGWEALAATSFADDLMGMDELGALRQVVADIGRVTSMPLGRVVADSFLEGPGALGLRWRGRRSMEYLLVKELDLAQKSVAETVSIWKQFSQNQVIPGTDIQLFSSQVGSQSVFYYVVGNIWALGSDFELMVQSLHLLLGDVGSKETQSALGELMTSRGIALPKPLTDVKGLTVDEVASLSLTFNFDVLREKDAEDMSQVPWTSDVQGLKLQYATTAVGESGETSSELELSLLHRESFSEEAERPYTHHQYITKSANLYTGFSDLPIEWIASKIEAKLSMHENVHGDGLSSELGFDFGIKSLASSSLSGEGFYSFRGLNPRGIEHVVGLKLKDKVDPFDGLKAVWKTLFRGQLEVSTLQHLDNARLVCGNDRMGFEPFCFALHGDYLLVGLRPSVRDSLKSAVGKAPTIRDREGLGQGFANSPTYVGALLVDVPGLAGALYKHVQSLSGEGMKREHVKEVLGPWFDGVQKIDGLGGLLTRSEEGRVTTTLGRF